MADAKQKLCVRLVLAVSVLQFAQCSAKSRTTDELSLSKVAVSNTNVVGNTMPQKLRSDRSLQCIPMLKHFEVELDEELKPGEGVGLTGDHTKLGQWQVNSSLELKVRRRNPLKWYLKVLMCSAVRIYFRFFIYYVDLNGVKRIRLWEGQQHARVFEPYDMYHSGGSAKFGRVYDLSFGGGVQTEKGWLRAENAIQLKFVWPQHIRFTAFSHFIRSPKYILKVTAFGTNDNKTYLPWKDDDIEIEVSRFIRFKSNLKPQSREGEYYKPGKILAFQITATQGMSNLYMLCIRSKEGEILGEVAIPPSLLALSEGILELPIYDARINYRVGWLTLPYLRVEPMANALDFSMRSSFHHYWPQNWPTLNVGHRGVGKSFYYHYATTIENTIESFLKAYNENNDMIELDVHLTKDYVPVVWNDSGFYTLAQEDDVQRNERTYVYIQDLKYDELVGSRVFVYMKGTMVDLSHRNTIYVDETERIFPTLKSVFKTLPLSLGMIVEIKWPQLLASGSLEYQQSLDKNKYIDAILRASMKHSCGRPLIFSSFDADVCTMIRLKQPIFPTLFVTVGEQSTWEPYADQRTLSFLSSVHFAQASDILGTAIYASEILRLPEYVSVAYKLQQVVFVWGDQMNSSQLLSYFRGLEVAGVIHDHLDKNISQTRKHAAIFEAPEVQRIFLRQCVTAGNVSITEGPPDTRAPFWPRLRSIDEL